MIVPWTTKLVVVVWVMLPLAPCTVNVAGPGGVELLVTTVNVEAPELVIDVGLNVAVVPAGKPVTLKFMFPAKPCTDVAVTV
jgi:hypothetical protein